MRIHARDRKHIDVYVLPKNHTEVPEPENEPYDNSQEDYEFTPPKLDFELNESNFGDEYFIYDEAEGEPKYKKQGKVWA